MISDAIEIAVEGLIKPFEGYHRRLSDGRCAAYADPGTRGHPWTIGWGSTGRGIEPDTVWTEQQAAAQLRNHVVYFASNLLRLSPSLGSEIDRRVAALISFSYNCGLGNYRVSTLKRRVDEGNWSDAAKEIMRWNKAAGRVLPGLTRRRAAEAAFLR